MPGKWFKLPRNKQKIPQVKLTWGTGRTNRRTDLPRLSGDLVLLAHDDLSLVGPTGPVVEFDVDGNKADLTYDPQGSCVATYKGALSNSPWMLYDAYGKPIAKHPNLTIDQASRIALNQPLQYKGQFGYIADAHTGAYYCTHRFYDPNTGRWLSRDPIGLEGGTNTYSYCNGNPVMLADPSGLEALDDWANFWAGAGDSLTFGGTGLARRGINYLWTGSFSDFDVVDEESGAYAAGVWTETGIEIVATLGSAATKVAAKQALKKGIAQCGTKFNYLQKLRAADRAWASKNLAKQLGAARKLDPKGMAVLHHQYSLMGHPSKRGLSAIFPIIGLPESLRQSKFMLKYVPAVRHNGIHAATVKAEAFLELIGKTTPFRILNNLLPRQ